MDTLKNSCDGCCAGMPVVNGMHINKKSLTVWGSHHMLCTKYRYDGTRKPLANLSFELKRRKPQNNII